ncbi:rhodanese-related sulfurtransferase [Paenactinomyces guangxiensis]|uniref:tRNA uridine(34) hydroxylase n=1 Tax=Paenactinomyces guangxiensis TaxID=1490290 RepID=A0A7W1WSJ9_9BACL|nr:rhodanese-related sulfurtransferase [Paenactinomyces guangxiensis]MBA4495056.1 rhodanese-related sulfurtransferase [Paenactinomyces guangxiensis]MBH8592260.1 rhodanese-related sulfurtransferase [Paenactinomyces guangxiensis]
MANEKNTYQILLFYKYVPIDDPVGFADEHRAFCQKLGIKGRILVAHEGINGTLSGTLEQTQSYIDFMRQHPLFHDMHFKVDDHDRHAFKKLFVRPKKELVTWRFEEDVDPNELTGKRLSPKEFYEQLQQDDVIVIDGRNDYEYDIGHFRNAIRPGVKTSREFPEWIRKNLSHYKDRKIITYCTGGIRCEKLTAFMLKEGFKDVAQLEGGIISYGKDPEVKGKLFDGKCYVFDERISVPINQVEEKIVGKCYHCGKPEDRYINCEYDMCHKQHICCPECEEKHQGYCSKECEEQDMVQYEG